MAVKPKILLFDLGGVIVPWVGIEALAEFNDIPHEEVSDRFARNEIFRDFERGQASEADFLKELPRAFDLPDGDVADLWNSWVHAPFPGILSALSTLKSKFTLGCLSNTNSLQFHFPFASHHLQEAKPDEACFTKAVNIMGAAPENVWFFDDSSANIEAAQALGLTAYHVDRRVGVLPVLKKLKLIP